jgi:tRNA-Thr(GGU) m(6)t(6)A37 methyltransferase TsaA
LKGIKKIIIMRPIAHVYTDLPEKFGTPRQCGIAPSLKGRIVFEPEFRVREAFRGLDGFSYIWVIWEFSESKPDPEQIGEKEWHWSPTVRPPRLGGNKRMGVFATRSPFRPNNLGLSSLKLDSIDFDDPEGPVLYVSGVDMIDGTPVFDIKPYISYSDSHPEATDGFMKDAKDQNLEVLISDDLISRIPEEKRDALLRVLELDPRPAYQDDESRIYGFGFADFEIKFTVCQNTLNVCDIYKVK